MRAKQRAPSQQAAASGELRHQNASRNGLRRERVTDIQRARLLAAMAEVACERGVANVTVAHVVERAGVSRRTFYELFEDCEDCFLAAFDEGVARVTRHVLDAYDPNVRWVDRVRAALTALLSFVEEDRSMGRLLVVESLAAGPEALRRRQRTLVPLIRAVREGVEREKRVDREKVVGQEKSLERAKRGSGPLPLTAEGVVGGVLAVLHARLSGQQSGPVLELLGPLMGMIVLPYLGATAARREIARPAPRAPASKRNAGVASLNHLHMRLTYRTIRVLSALAANPGSSNRRVADASGISDQGQMSKLLARLRHLGLIENTSVGSAARGEPNAWTLTSEGWHVQSALAQQNGD